MRCTQSGTKLHDEGSCGSGDIFSVRNERVTALSRCAYEQTIVPQRCGIYQVEVEGVLQPAVPVISDPGILRACPHFEGNGNTRRRSVANGGHANDGMHGCVSAESNAPWENASQAARGRLLYGVREVAQAVGSW